MAMASSGSSLSRNLTRARWSRLDESSRSGFYACSYSLRPGPSRYHSTVLAHRQRHVKSTLVASPPSRVWLRGARKKSGVILDDIPQGPLPSTPLEPVGEDDGPVYPTLLQEVRNNMNKFDNCVLLTKVGNFYEVSFDE
jgi:hypothetical protein